MHEAVALHATALHCELTIKSGCNRSRPNNAVKLGSGAFEHRKQGACTVTCRRRNAAYKASHEGDIGSQKASQAAHQLWWDDKRALLETDAAAEAEAAKAASTK